MVELFLLGIWITYFAVLIIGYLVFTTLRDIKKALDLLPQDLTKPHRVSTHDVISTEEFNYLYELDSTLLESFRHDWLAYLTSVKNHMSFYEYIIRRKRERVGMDMPQEKEVSNG